LKVQFLLGFTAEVQRGGKALSLWLGDNPQLFPLKNVGNINMNFIAVGENLQATEKTTLSSIELKVG
jgi:hypothetical protein